MIKHMSNKLNITDKTVFKNHCEVCQNSNKLTLQNKGIILYEELESWEKREILEQIILVCPNCGVKTTVGHMKTGRYEYSEWVTYG